jgi:hypothetical protein
MLPRTQPALSALAALVLVLASLSELSAFVRGVGASDEYVVAAVNCWFDVAI